MGDVIRVLKGPERVRLRPAVVFGDDGADGAMHAVEMMLSVMASECIDGYSPSLEVTVFNDHSIGVKNFGRGIYFGDPQSNDDTLWKDMFCEIYARSRYEDTKDSNTRYTIFAEPYTTPKREYSIEDYDDLFLCAIQYACEYMDVVSVRDNYQYTLHFEKGYNIGGLQKVACNQASETQIRFKLDNEVFSDIVLPQDFLPDQLKALALLNPGIRCVLQIEGEEVTQVFSFPLGAIDYISGHRAQGFATPIFTNTVIGMGQERYNRPAYKARVEVTVSFEENNGYIKCFHNQRELTFGGTHIHAILSKICNYIPCRTGASPSSKQLQQHLQLIVTTYSSATTYWENGTRRSICNTVIKDMAEDTLDEGFMDFLTNNSNLIEQIFVK